MEDERLMRCASVRHEGAGEPVLPELRLCADCRDELELGLVELPDWYEMCAYVLDVRSERGGERVSGHRPHGIALREAVVAVRSDILGVLAAWCGLVVAERGVRGPDELGIRALVGFLGIHVRWLAAHPAAADMVDELAELRRAATSVVGRPAPTFRQEIGVCDQPGCDAVVRAEGGAPGDPQRVGCDAGHEWGPEQWLLLKRKLSGPGEKAGAAE